MLVGAWLGFRACGRVPKWVMWQPCAWKIPVLGTALLRSRMGTRVGFRLICEAKIGFTGLPEQITSSYRPTENCRVIFDWQPKNVVYPDATGSLT